MKRHRLMIPTRLEMPYRIYNWNVVDEEYQLTSTQPLPSYHQTDARFSAFDDVVSDGKWNYNDATHEKWYATYGTIVDNPTVPDAHLKFIKAGPSPALFEAHDVPCGYIIANIHDKLGKRPLSPFSARRVESWLQSQLLPTRITVDRDPFESGFSIWFLVADLLTLPRLAASLLLRSRSLDRQLLGSKSMRQVADDHLAIKFGVQAFHRDVVDFLGVLQRFYNAVEEVEKHTNDIYRWHAAKLDVSSYLPEITAPQIIGFDMFGVPMFDVNRITENAHASFTRTMAYRVRCPELRGWLARLKQFVDLFGILDPAAIWDLIPFSFVLDWFLPIGQWVHGNKPRLFPTSVECLDYCESIKLDFECRYRACDPVLNGASGDPIYYGFFTGTALDRNIGTEFHSTYVRRRYRPEDCKIGQQSRSPMLRLENCSVAVSLIAQRIPRTGLIGDEFEGVNFSRSPQLPTTPEGFVTTEADRRWAESMRAKRASRLGENPALLKFEYVPKRGSPVNPRLPNHPRRGKMMQWKSLRDLSTGYLPGFHLPPSQYGYLPVAP